MSYAPSKCSTSAIVGPEMMINKISHHRLGRSTSGGCTIHLCSRWAIVAQCSRQNGEAAS